MLLIATSNRRQLENSKGEGKTRKRGMSGTTFTSYIERGNISYAIMSLIATYSLLTYCLQLPLVEGDPVYPKLVISLNMHEPLHWLSFTYIFPCNRLVTSTLFQLLPALQNKVYNAAGVLWDCARPAQPNHNTWLVEQFFQHILHVVHRHRALQGRNSSRTS